MVDMMSLPASTVVSSAGVLVLPVLEPASPAEEDTPEEAAGAEEATVLESAWEPAFLLLPQAARLRAMARDKVKARNFFIQTDLLYFGAPASQGDTLSINHYSMHSQ